MECIYFVFLVEEGRLSMAQRHQDHIRQVSIRIGYDIFAVTLEGIKRFEISRDTPGPEVSGWYDSSISTLKWCLTVWVSSKQRHLESYSILILCICSQWINFYIYIGGCRRRHVTDLGWQAVGTLCILILFNSSSSTFWDLFDYQWHYKSLSTVNNPS